MDGDNNQHVDAILKSVNPLGKYQLLHILLSWISQLGGAFQLFANVFTGFNVDYSCAAPTNTTEYIEAYDDDHSNLTLVLGKCHIHLMENNTQISNEPCPNGFYYPEAIDKSTVSQFELVCDRKNLQRLSQTLVIAGQGFGAIISTIISDRMGRKTVLVASNLGLAAVGLVIAFSPNIVIFCVAKFFVGALQQGTITSSSTLILELLPTKHRRLGAVTGGLGWASGVMFLSLVSFICKGYSWRTLQTVLSLVSLLGLLQWYLLDESLRWTIVNGKRKEAKKIVQRAARINGRNLEDIVSKFNDFQLLSVNSSLTKGKEKKQNFQAVAVQKMTFLDIFKVRRILMNALCMWFAWFTTATAFFVIYLTATSLAGDPYLNFFLTALMEAPSNIFFFFGLNRFGRKRCAQLTFSILGTGLVCAGIFKSLSTTDRVYSTLTLISSLLAMMGGSGCFGMVYLLTPEMFPTNLRNQALGISSFFGRVGGMLAPFSGILAEQAIWAPGLLMGTMAVIVCILIGFVPETNERELPQTVAELEEWFKDKDGGKRPKL